MSFPRALPSKSVGTPWGIHFTWEEYEAPRPLLATTWQAPTPTPTPARSPAQPCRDAATRWGEGFALSRRAPQTLRSLRCLSALVSCSQAPVCSHRPRTPQRTNTVTQSCISLLSCPLDRPLGLRVPLAHSRGPGAGRFPQCLRDGPCCLQRFVSNGMPASHALKISLEKS